MNPLTRRVAERLMEVPLQAPSGYQLPCLEYDTAIKMANLALAACLELKPGVAPDLAARLTALRSFLEYAARDDGTGNNVHALGLLDDLQAAIIFART